MNKNTRNRLLKVANSLSKASGTKHIASGSDIFYKIVPKEYAIDLYDRLSKEDKQSAKLFLEVTYELQKQLTLSEGAEHALSRVIGIIANWQRWEPDLLRNNIFKAANSLGMKLPSSNF